MHLRFERSFIGCLLLACGGATFADEVVFNNGDRLTGQVLSASDGKLIISSKVAGEVKVDLKEVKTFSSDKPLTVVMKDGSVYRQPLQQAQAGSVATAPGAAGAGKQLALSEIKTVNPPSHWSGAITAGAIVSRGNTYTDSVNAGAEARRRSDDDRLSLAGAYNYGREKPKDEEQAKTTIENWFALGKYDYFITPKWYLYTNMKVERDNIANLDLRLTPGIGAGYQWIESGRTNFNTEAGISWVRETYSDPSETRQYFAGRFAYHLDHKITDRVQLIHNLEWLPSLEISGQYLLNSDAGVRTTISNGFFTELKIVLSYNSEPAEDAESTDVKYMANVGWQF